MGVLGPNYGTVFANDATVGTVDFSNPSNVGADDGASAGAILILGAKSHYLKVQGFQFAIPSDATIDGILLEVDRSATISLAMVDFAVRTVKAGAIGASDKADQTNWPIVDGFATYGGLSDKWADSWVADHINDATFGVAVSAQANLAATANINCLRLTVAYTGSNRAGVGDGARVKVGDGMGLSGVLG